MASGFCHFIQREQASGVCWLEAAWILELVRKGWCQLVSGHFIYWTVSGHV